jgi:hypothetical protein
MAATNTLYNLIYTPIVNSLSPVKRKSIGAAEGQAGLVGAMVAHSETVAKRRRSEDYKWSTRPRPEDAVYALEAGCTRPGEAPNKMKKAQGKAIPAPL